MTSSIGLPAYVARTFGSEGFTKNGLVKKRVLKQIEQSEKTPETVRKQARMIRQVNVLAKVGGKK